MNTETTSPIIYTADEIEAGMRIYAEKHFGKSGKLINKRADKATRILFKSISQYRDAVVEQIVASEMKKLDEVATNTKIVVDGIPFDDDL